MYSPIQPSRNVAAPARALRDTLTAQHPLVLYGGGDPPLSLSSEADLMKGKALQTSRLPVPEIDSEPAAPPTAPGDAESGAQVVEADIDGRRVRIVAQDEIVLECGQASVTLRRNGRIIIRGTYVETHSEGTNRIKGGQVRIN
jgi:hypothetical protein